MPARAARSRDRVRPIVVRHLPQAARAAPAAVLVDSEPDAPPAEPLRSALRPHRSFGRTPVDSPFSALGAPFESAFYPPAPGRAFFRCTRVLEEGQHMRRFVITRAPGAGKTAIIRQLELDGFSVVEEVATDIIAAHARGADQPWMHPSFIDDIALLQRNPAASRVASTGRRPVPRPVRRVHRGVGRLPGVPAVTGSCRRTRAHPEGRDLRKPGLLHPQSRVRHTDRRTAHQLRGHAAVREHISIANAIEASGSASLLTDLSDRCATPP